MSQKFDSGFTKSQILPFSGRKCVVTLRESLAREDGEILVLDGGAYFLSEFFLQELSEAHGLPERNDYDFVYEVFAPEDPDGKFGGHGIGAIEIF